MSAILHRGKIEIVPVCMRCTGGVGGFSQPILIVPTSLGWKRDIEDFRLPTDDVIIHVVGDQIHRQLYRQELSHLEPFSVLLTDQDMSLVKALNAAGVVFLPFETQADSSASDVVYAGLRTVQEINEEAVRSGLRFRSWPNVQIPRPCHNKDWRTTAEEMRDGVDRFIASTPSSLIRGIVLPDPERGFIEVLRSSFAT